MRVGSLDVSYRAVVYAATILVVIIALLKLWTSGADTRAESIYRGTIVRGLYDESVEALNAGVDACKNVVATRPEKAAPRLTLGVLLHRRKEYKEAQKAFQEAADLPKATPQEKAWALVGAGVCCFSAAPDDPKAADEAEKLFRGALQVKLDKGESTDAIASLALLEMRKGTPASIAEAEKLCNQALAASVPASLRIQAQLSNLHGVIQSRKGRMFDALRAFGAALAIRPDGGASSKEFAENRRIAGLGGVLEKDLDPKQRAEMLQKISGEIELYGSQKVAALVVSAKGWSMLKGGADYLTGPYARAHQALQSAERAEPANVLHYRARSALVEDRIQDVARKLTAPVSGIKGETPTVSIWSGDKPVKFAPEDGAALNEIRNLLREQETILANAVEKVKTPADKIDCKLRQVAALRRMILLLNDNETKVRADLQAKVLKVGTEMVALDEKNAQSHFSLGQVQLECGDLAGALASFKTAKAAGHAAASLAPTIAALDVKPEVLDVRPTDTRRSYGDVPLVVASLKSATSGYKSVSMLLDDKEVSPVIAGTQVLYLPADAAALDGSHTVKLTVTDKSGNTLKFPEFGFGIDKKPPALKIVPDTGTTLNAKAAVWEITITDLTGVDISTISVMLKTVKGPVMINREIVKDGKYKFGFPDLQPAIKAGAMASESFRIGATQELQPGEYSLTITASDLNGNQMNETKTYSAK